MRKFEAEYLVKIKFLENEELKYFTIYKINNFSNLNNIIFTSVLLL